MTAELILSIIVVGFALLLISYLVGVSHGTNITEKNWKEESVRLGHAEWKIADLSGATEWNWNEPEQCKLKDIK